MLTVLRRYGTLIGFAAILIFFWISLPDTFMTARNWLNISQQMSMLIVAAAGMTLVMVMGDFDLSIGSMASLAGIVAAILFSFDYPIWAAVSIALIVGLAGGAVNGLLISFVGILPFVATLATLTMLSGAAFVVSGGKTISGRVIPEAFGNFAREGISLGNWGGVAVSLPNLTIVALIVAVLVWVLLEQTTFGRRLYAIGGNSEAAHLSGVA
ncbi:MAG: rbsC, partial [Devosia sp.]|nr:rbsC [Devosia sp.]